MFALISLAFAVDTVVYPGGNPAEAQKRVEAATGAAATDLRAVSVAELMKGHAPTGLTGAHVQVCSGTPTSSDAMKTGLTRAEGSVKYVEYVSARAALDEAIKDLDCLQGAVDPALASRAFYLRGIVNAADGDQAASRADFRRARLFAPAMAWDSNFAPSLEPNFDAIASEMKSARPVTLSVLPAPADGTFLLDGQPAHLINGAVGIADGEHYVQLTGAAPVTLTLNVDSNSSPTIVIPSAVGPEVLDWASDSEKRGALTAVLVSALGTDGVVYVVNPEVVWRVKLGGAAWDLVTTKGEGVATAPAAGKTPTKPPAAVKAPAAVAPPTPVVKPAPAPVVAPVPAPAAAPAPLPTTSASVPSPRKHSAAGPVLMVIGGAMGVGGGIVGILGQEKIDTAAATAKSYGTGRTQAETDAFNLAAGKGQTEALLGFIPAGVGAALLATGVVVTVKF